MYIKVISKDDAVNFSNQLNDGNWMVFYYADWCGHCQTMKPEWETVANKLSNSNNLNIAEVNSDYINDLLMKPQINGFPTIKMYNQGAERANFDDERIAEKIEQFAMSNSPIIRMIKKIRKIQKSQKKKASKPKSIKKKASKPKSLKKKVSKPKSMKKSQKKK